MGVVFEGYDHRLDRAVALKRLKTQAGSPDQARARFRHEARVVAKLQHPNIVHIYDWMDESDGDWIVMELINGRSLKEILAEGPLRANEVIDLALGVTAGLAAAHEAGIIHRDLKAANVVMAATGDPKILDFGVAKRVSQGSDSPSPMDILTTEGKIIGTVSAMSPEQALGRRVDERSDLFSMGLLLYEAAVGVRPFVASGSMEILTQICSLRQVPASEANPDVPASLSHLIDALLEKEPLHRPQTAREVLSLLEDLRVRRIPAQAKKTPDTADIETLSRPYSSYPSDFPLAPLLDDSARMSGHPQRRQISRRLAAGATTMLLLALTVLAWFGQQQANSRSPKQLATIGSVVALPSQVMAGIEEPYLADAVPNTISTQLSRVSELEIKLPPSSLDVERVGGDLEKIIESYGVDAIILSRLDSEAGQLVLSLQLVDAFNRNLIWSREYVGQLSGYLGLARRAADGIRETLYPGSEILRPASDEPSDSEAELLIQQGRYYSNLYSNLGRAGDAERALAAFTGALEIAPRRADAAAEMAILHTAKVYAGAITVEEARPEIELLSKVVFGG